MVQHSRFTWLTETQGSFALAFCANGKRNATESAIQAGYSSKSARTTCRALLRHPGVNRAMAILDRGKEIRMEVTRSRIEQEFASVGLTNISDFATWDEEGRVQVKASCDIPPEALAAIKSLKINKRGGIDIETHDKTGALNSLAKIHDMFHDGSKISFDFNNMPPELANAVKNKLIERIHSTPLALNIPQTQDADFEVL